MGRRPHDIQGKQFGFLTVIRKAGLASKSGAMLWLCKCECGNYKKITASALQHGLTKSCGTPRLEAHIYGKDYKYLNYYKKHLHSARRRGIPFRLDFEQWISIWKESGHLDERGRSGYVMARFGDTGAYEIGNVRIITTSDNTKEYFDDYRKNNSRQHKSRKYKAHDVTA
jgi:hypothetical protein